MNGVGQVQGKNHEHERLEQHEKRKTLRNVWGHQFRADLKLVKSRINTVNLFNFAFGLLTVNIIKVPQLYTIDKVIRLQTWSYLFPRHRGAATYLLQSATRR